MKKVRHQLEAIHAGVKEPLGPPSAHHDEHLMLTFLWGRHADRLGLVYFLQEEMALLPTHLARKGKVSLPSR